MVLASWLAAVHVCGVHWFTLWLGNDIHAVADFLLLLTTRCIECFQTTSHFALRGVATPD